MAVSYPTRLTLNLGGYKLSPLMALLLLCVNQARLDNAGVPVNDRHILRDPWRRWLASNLTETEFRRKGFVKSKAAVWLARTFKLCRDSGLVGTTSEDFWSLTGGGRAVAEQCRALFQPAMGKHQFADYVSSLYIAVTGRVE